MQNNNIICSKCKLGLEKKNVKFNYLEHEFFTEVYACPICGQIYIDKNLAAGKMADLEKLLEEK